MKKHEKAGIIDHLIASFMRIKSISASGEIDNICVDGVSKLYALSDAEGIQKQLDEVRQRRIDPTN